jgi:hypothetical protein
MTRLAIGLGLLVIVTWWLIVSRKKGGLRGRSLRPGPGTAGTIYDMLNEDKRKALEIIVEQRAEERRPEYPDGNLPDLESPKRTKDEGPRTRD